MAIDPKHELVGLLRRALGSVAPDAADEPIHLERPREAAHGDFASNLAMRLARRLGKNPRELAARLLAELPLSPHVRKVEVAGAGFINFTLDDSLRREVARQILVAGRDYGRSQAGGGQKLLLEFVSANPTGPLHVGHGRGAAYGASLANLLAFAGWDVTREYYVNDAGRQMDILAVSAWLRYLALCGKTLAFPPNAYQGDYVRRMAEQLRGARGERYLRPAAAVLAEVPALPDAARNDAEAKALRERHLDVLIANARKLLGADWQVIHQHVLAEQLADGRSDLEEFGVAFDVWFSEKALFDMGLVRRSVERLEEAGHVYLQDGAKWFRSTTFGDEKDRVVQRENGIYTYFASDIAYHANKFERGFARLINIWGADHHGYIPRVKGALKALGLDAERLDIALVQFAVLYRGGQKAAMSTRSGEFVTLRALREEVGGDACRFFYVLQKADQHLDFDLDLAQSQTSKNPVYYIQYAHARIASVLREWGGDVAELAGADLSPLEDPREMALCARLAAFADVIETAAAEYAPHQVAFYVKDLAADFHAFYHHLRILSRPDAPLAPELQLARLALVAAVRQVIYNGMVLLGVSCPESM
ncbi:MAG: arginine--tRNA ligase [Zoogloeaceae bacterium]|jgi:arginyl-tRNA synthetase|nr:arginine--tRNA ligase [Zoogloeaceae bacterium]